MNTPGDNKTFDNIINPPKNRGPWVKSSSSKTNAYQSLSFDEQTLKQTLDQEPTAAIEYLIKVEPAELRILGDEVKEQLADELFQRLEDGELDYSSNCDFQDAITLLGHLAPERLTPLLAKFKNNKHLLEAFLNWCLYCQIDCDIDFPTEKLIALIQTIKQSDFTTSTLTSAITLLGNQQSPANWAHFKEFAESDDEEIVIAAGRAACESFGLLTLRQKDPEKSPLTRLAERPQHVSRQGIFHPLFCR